MATIKNSDVKIVPPEDYPPLLSRSKHLQAIAMLKNAETLAKANGAIAAKTAELRGAVLELVGGLESAMKAGDWTSVFAGTHEIRGLAGMAGLGATGRIANVYCQYVDSTLQFGLDPDETVCALHLDALIRSAHSEDDAARHGDAVAQELSALVTRKLSEIKDPARD
jgi:hypothetical protein